METLSTVVGVGVLVLVFVLAARRRSNMTPEQRQIADLQSETRKLKREQRRQRYD